MRIVWRKAKSFNTYNGILAKLSAVYSSEVTRNGKLKFWLALIVIAVVVLNIVRHRIQKCVYLTNNSKRSSILCYSLSGALFMSAF